MKCAKGNLQRLNKSNVKSVTSVHNIFMTLILQRNLKKKIIIKTENSLSSSLETNTSRTGIYLIELLASSKLKSTPPIGAPNATDTPAAAEAEIT